MARKLVIYKKHQIYEVSGKKLNEDVHLRTKAYRMFLIMASKVLTKWVT